ncbi:hypothetical protein LUW75_02920 [Streptomyces sp. MRC013]|uniref:hypothetical protein n=1 Tax=Streptomyces sp. MRC013 TaxID=2898276 RepID=UPI0020270B68|nr:hypothetical protein [Streptomyces sp. MRC013]URM89133.1 hypothetical protein LUW75_02920 [Streptomyces sp. MRC013]
MRRKSVLALLAAPMAAAALLGTARSAGADTTGATAVRAGTLKLYEHDDYKGGYRTYNGTDRFLKNDFWRNPATGKETTRSVNDGASSMKNDTGHAVFLYQHGDGRRCSGLRYTAEKYSKDSDLSRNSSNPSFDNKASCVVFQ